MRKPGDREGYLADLEDVKAVRKRVEKLEQRVKELEKKLDKIPGLRYDPDTGAILVRQEGD